MVNDALKASDVVVALSAVASEADARRMARTLVTERLVACVNIVPNVTSVYAWKGAIEESNEWLLVMKTTAVAFERLTERLREIHSYEVPECIQIAVPSGYAPYLDWVRGNVGPSVGVAP